MNFAGAIGASQGMKTSSALRDKAARIVRPKAERDFDSSRILPLTLQPLGA